MASPFDKLKTGAPVTAFSITAWNQLLDMLEWWKATQGQTGGGGAAKLDIDQDVFQCRNDTGDDLLSYQVVGLDGPLFLPSDSAEFANKTPLKGVLPTDADHKRKFGIMLVPVMADKIGLVCLSGVCPVKLDVTAEDDPCATVANEDPTHLVTGSDGVPVLWVDVVGNADASGYRWGLVSLGGGASTTRMAWATTSAAVCPADTTATVTTIVPCDGSTWNGDDPLTVKNDPDGYTIALGARGKIVYVYDDDEEWAWHFLDYSYDCDNTC